MSRTILCVVELDKYPRHVVERATWLAKSTGSDLHLLVSDPAADALGESFVFLLESQHIAESIRASQDEAVAELVASVKASGVKVEVHPSKDRRVAAVIRKEAATLKPMYVIKGTHYHTPTERASLSDADWDLIRELEYPIWFVKPVVWNDAPVIVAAIDPMHSRDKPANLDRQIIEQAQRVADCCGGHLKVVHTYQTLDEIGSRVTWVFKPGKLAVNEINARMRDEHDRAFRSFTKSVGIPADASYLLPGRAHEILPSFAMEQNASLVVMGALARSKLKQRIVGSTAVRVLDHIRCDVLVAHP